jgi:uncharacterized BrkB/YihY/UPF0761 family membrane protein
VFGGDRGSKLHTAHLAQIIRETHHSVDFCGLFWKLAQTLPQMYRQKTNSTNLGFQNASDLLQCLALLLLLLILLLLLLLVFIIIIIY